MRYQPGLAVLTILSAVVLSELAITLLPLWVIPLLQHFPLCPLLIYQHFQQVLLPPRPLQANLLSLPSLKYS